MRQRVEMSGSKRRMMAGLWWVGCGGHRFRAPPDSILSDPKITPMPGDSAARSRRDPWSTMSVCCKGRASVHMHHHSSPNFPIFDDSSHLPRPSLQSPARPLLCRSERVLTTAPPRDSIRIVSEVSGFARQVTPSEPAAAACLEGRLRQHGSRWRLPGLASIFMR